MTKEVKLGIIGILALLILFFGIKYLKGINLFHPANYYYVEYSNIQGLPGSSPVFANGYKIGTVSDIEYDYNKPNSIIVKVDIDKKMKIPKGTTGELVTEMLGTVKMNLILANGKNGFYSPGDTLKGEVNTGLIGVAQNELIPQFNSLLPKIDSIFISINKLLNDKSLNQTLNNTAEITANLKYTTAELNRLMENDLPRITGRLITITDNFSSISTQLKDINYVETFSKVDSTLANVQNLTSKLSSKDNTIGLLLNDPTLYNNLSNTSKSAGDLMEDLKANPKRYVHFSLFGRKK